MMSCSALVLMAVVAGAGPSGIAESKHNLSVSGPGRIKSTQETEICIFCHGTHKAAGDALDNRPQSQAVYRGYTSSTLRAANVRGPTGSSRVCLSCHDGTVALAQAVGSSRPRSLSMLDADGAGRLPAGPSNLGTDFSSTHPFSVKPPEHPEYRAPPAGDAVRLDADGQVQCVSCHDPHREDADPVQRKFLVKDNRGSSLCLSCHSVEGWSSNPSAHQSSFATFDAERGATAGYTTVADNGCQACHDSHGAREPKRLTKADDDRLCMICHGGRVARLDLSVDLRKPQTHLVGPAGESGHDASEGPDSAQFPLPETRSTQRRHATCVDCHNPHQAFHHDAERPLAKGALAGVWGVDKNGQRVAEVRYEYEVCFKCHADSANKPQSLGPRPPETLRRALQDANLRDQFAASAASFHPVVSAGRNPSVPSLKAPWTTSSQVYCSDCHASDSGAGAGGFGPRGPHGSVYPHLLERNLSTADMTVESPQAYALCYKCHDREVLLSRRSSFPPHARHLGDGTPCTACHAAHGVSALQGNPVNNAHLIDFDTAIVRGLESGPASYTSRGPRSGSCTVSCHNVSHRNTGY